ncbi:MAG: ATP-binding protein, partial [Candidatus Thorarchaeota archaeon]
PKRKIIGSDGHFGQVLPIEDAAYIIENLAVEPLTLNYCMCRYICRAEKDARCLIFGVNSGVMDKIPRYIPENVKRPLDREDAVKIIDEFSQKGFVQSIWFHPVPLIGGLCSCEDPECMGIRLRLNYGLEILYKAEYVVQLNPDLCEGCKSCIGVCQFSALNYSPWKDRVVVNLDRCFGCGVCRNICPNGALTLMPRKTVTAVAGQY